MLFFVYIVVANAQSGVEHMKTKGQNWEAVFDTKTNRRKNKTTSWFSWFWFCSYIYIYKFVENSSYSLCSVRALRIINWKSRRPTTRYSPSCGFVLFDWQRCRRLFGEVCCECIYVVVLVFIEFTKSYMDIVRGMKQ